MRLFFWIIFAQYAFSAEFGLKVGEKAPPFTAQDVYGKPFDFANSLKQGPLVLVFYRGGWCPFCNLQLQSIEKKLYPELKKYQASLVAISTDKPDPDLGDPSPPLSFQVISDHRVEILPLYHLVFKPNADILKKYQEKLNANIMQVSGGVIAIPAVFVVESKGSIIYSFVDEDYKVRAPIEEVLQALQKTATIVDYPRNNQG